MVAALLSGCGQTATLGDQTQTVRLLRPKGQGTQQCALARFRAAHPELVKARPARPELAKVDSALPKRNAKDCKPITVAVMDFENHSVTDQKKYEPLRQGLRDWFVSDLARIKQFRMVERARINQILKELRLGLSDLVNPATAARVGRLLGAEALVLGSFTIIGEQARIDTRIVHVETGSFLRARGITGPSKDLVRLEKTLALLLLDEFGVLVDDRVKGVLWGGPQPTPVRAD